MKYILVLTMVAVLAGCGKEQTSGPQFIDEGKLEGMTFMIAGQSNGVSPSNGYPSIYSQTGLVTINDFYHNTEYFRVPTVSDPNDSGMTWIKLGDLFNREVFFNVVANGGTTTKQWVDTYHYRILNALKVKRYSAIIWVQGESDVYFTADESYNNLRFVIEQSRIIQPGIPWYVALDGASNPAAARAAQLRLISERYVRLGADIDEVRKDPANGIGELEGPGWDVFAQMWHDILIKDIQ